MPIASLAMNAPGKILWVLTLIATALFAGCISRPDTGKMSFPTSGKTLFPLEALQKEVFVRPHDFEFFRKEGPFDVQVHQDIDFLLSPGQIVSADLYLPSHSEAAPLAVFVHGYDSFKDNHAYQAQHLASWGINSLAIQLPNKGPWIENGRILAKLIRLIRQVPGTINARVNTDRIILIGHSFGGASVAVAISEGVGATGGILLDPATTNRTLLPPLLRKVNAPILIIGADKTVAESRNRDLFYRNIQQRVAEISIAEASHEDAQFPAPFALTTLETQITFRSAITSAVFSLAYGRSLIFAMESYGSGLASGKMLGRRQK